MTIRDALQDDVVQKYISSGLRKCTLVLSTGFGKSKVAIDIIKYKQPHTVYIFVNSDHLKTNSWKKEFIKYGLEDYYNNNVITETYQTAYKWTEDNIPDKDAFIIMDEADFAADVPEFSKVFYTFKDYNILALTGFITESKKLWFEIHCPVLFTYTSEEAQDDGVLNKIRFTFVKYDLSKNPKDITVTYKKAGIEKSFSQSENSAYAYAEEKFIKAIVAKSMLMDKFAYGEIPMEEYERKISQADYLINKASSDRRDLLLHSIASAEKVKLLISYLLKENPDSKIIIFSKRNEQSLKICGPDNVYNGTLDKKALQSKITDFEQGTIKFLGVCDKINRGANIENLNIGILESFFGSDTNAVQRFGRLMRLDPNEIADLFILLPYYLKKKEDKETMEVTYECIPTQQVAWARNMLRSTKVKLMRVWDYRSIKSNN